MSNPNSSGPPTLSDRTDSITIINGGIVFSGIETLPAGGGSTKLSLTKSLHSIDADAAPGGDTYTLEDGTIGQIMTITMFSGAGTATITPDNLNGGTNVLLNGTGTSAMLQFVDTSWYVIGGNDYLIT